MNCLQTAALLGSLFGLVWIYWRLWQMDHDE